MPAEVSLSLASGCLRCAPKKALRCIQAAQTLALSTMLSSGEEKLPFGEAQASESLSHKVAWSRSSW